MSFKCLHLGAILSNNTKMHDGNVSSLVFFVFSLQGVSSMVFDEQPSLSLVSWLKCFYTLRSYTSIYKQTVYAFKERCFTILSRSGDKDAILSPRKELNL